MALKTNLNISPYYDDFDEDDNFHRILFRPGYAIQARELTQLQSILQKQIEQFGRHIFQEGSIVVPGDVVFNNRYQSIKLKTTFGGETINPSQYYNPTAGERTVITGQTSGVKAEVIGYSDAGSDASEPLLYLNYINSGNSGKADIYDTRSQNIFADGEKIQANVDVIHTTSYGVGAASAEIFESDDDSNPSASYGSIVRVEEGVFYVKGNFVKTPAQSLVLGYNDPFPSARVGFKVNEEFVTPEADTSLLDNATGSSNYAAKGAHRLKVTLTLATKRLDNQSNDSDFVELMRISNGTVQSKTVETQYSILAEELARRTYDESGDYSVVPNGIEIVESVDNEVGGDIFLGEYGEGEITDDYLPAGDDFLTMRIGPGSSYVNGYEQENLSTVRKSILKARNVQNFNNGNTNFEIGNYFKVRNVYGTPDIGDVSNETTPYRPMLLWDAATDTRGSGPSAGNAVGVLRCRAFQHEQDGALGAGSSSSNDNAVFRFYAFDVRNFVKLTMSDTPSPTVISNFTNGGVQVTGSTSGATGFVFNDTTSFPDTTFTSGTNIFLTNIIGEFETGENIKVSDGAESDLIVENSSNQNLTISSIVVSKLSDARMIQMQETDSGQDFTADIVLQELEPGRISLFADESSAAGQDRVPTALEEDSSERLALQTELGAVLQFPEQQQSLFKLPKNTVKTLLTDKNNNVSDTDISIRKQFVDTTNTAGVVSFSAGAGEVFVPFAEKDYTLSVLTAGGGTAVQGDIISLSGKVTGIGTSTITITDSTLLGSSAKVKFTGTLNKSEVNQAVKTTNLSKQLQVEATAATGAFGTRATDETISLGRTDVYRIQAVYDSEDTSTEATAPTLTVSDITGNFERGERIKGSISGARGRLITTSSPLSYTLTLGAGADDFEEGETVTGVASGATATIDTDGVTDGSKVITKDFEFDDGQRNNYYDISRLVRRKNTNAPTGKLLVVYDYLSHGAGNFFSVDSYSSVSGQMNYDDIPVFIPTVTDPDDPAPPSEFPLTDCFDFRPTVENIAGTSETLTDIDKVTGNSFDYRSRQFDGTGAVVVDTPQPDSLLKADFEFYIPKIVCLYIDRNGEFIVLEGSVNETPVSPAPLAEAMKIAELYLEPYTFKPTDVEVEHENNLRYRMTDIGDLEQRINNLEYYTSLTLLDLDLKTKEIVDIDGRNRFKSGFITDPFTGHEVGDTTNPDYEISIDSQNRELRPNVVTKVAPLELALSSIASQKASGFQRTGKLITLPYTNFSFIDNRFDVDIDDGGNGGNGGTDGDPPDPTYEGNFGEGLDPPKDNYWEDLATKINRQKVHTQYNNAKAAAEKHNAGQEYGDWNWIGSKTPYGTATHGYGEGKGYSGYYGRHYRDRGEAVRLYEFKYEQKKKRTRTLHKVKLGTGFKDGKAFNHNTIENRRAYMRQVEIHFAVDQLKPETEHYIFFGKRNVTKFCTPASGTYSASGVRQTGSVFKTDKGGRLEGQFNLPDHRGDNNKDKPKWETGTLDFEVTSSIENDQTIKESYARTEFESIGGTKQKQYDVIANRRYTIDNRHVDSETVSGTRYQYFWGTAEGKRLALGQWVDLQGKYTIEGRPLQGTDKSPYRTSSSAYVNAGQTRGVDQHIQALVEAGVLVVSNDGERVALRQKYQKTSPGSVSREADSFLSLPKYSGKPIDQTFAVQSRSGIFVTSVSLYFTSKSAVDGTTVSIVTTQKGIPTNIQVPYSIKTLKSDRINADVNGDTPTIFRFPSPVYLQAGQKYAIRVSSNGNVNKLKIGDTSKGDSKHSSLGTLYGSTTNNTFDQGSDSSHVRMNLRAARFDTNQVGKVTLQNSVIGEKFNLENGDVAYAKRLINPRPVELTNASKVIKVDHIDHGMYSTKNNVVISGVSSGVTTKLDGSISATGTTLTLKSSAGFTSSATHVASASSVRLKIDNELFSGTLSDTTFTVTGRGTVGYGTTSGASVSHADGATVELYMLHGIPLNEINNTHTSIGNIEINSYTIETSTAPTVTGSVTTIRAGGNNVYATENYRYETFKTALDVVEIPKTGIGAEFRPTTGTSPGGSETPFDLTSASDRVSFEINSGYSFSDTHLISSLINEQNEMNGSKSMILDLTLTSSDPNLSPVLDTSVMDFVCVANRLDNVTSSADVYPTTNYRSHTAPKDDSATALYFTLPVQLETSARAIKLFLDVHKPPSATVLAMFRTLTSEGDDDIRNVPFQFFKGSRQGTNGIPDSGVAISAQKPDEFAEYSYTAGISDAGSGNALDEFSQFQIKLVMKGTDAAEPPRIKNLRAIALAT